MIDNTPDYFAVMRKLKVKDPLGGKTPADIALAKATATYAGQKERLAEAVRRDWKKVEVRDNG